MMAGESIPRAFVELHRAGRFDYWGAPYDSLTEEERSRRIRTHRSQVLWWRTIEWDRSPEEVASFRGDDTLRPGLIPFAGNGYGDEYCWYPRWQNGPEPPVAFFVHDELESHLFASNFAECLCRCLLQHFVSWDEAEERDEDSLVPMRTLWDAHSAIITPYLNPILRALVGSVGDRLTADACEKADGEIAARVGTRSLIGAQQPTHYHDDLIEDASTLLRCYDQSVAFYRELVIDEAREEFRPKLEQTIAAREAARARIDSRR